MSQELGQDDSLTFDHKVGRIHSEYGDCAEGPGGDASLVRTELWKPLWIPEEQAYEYGLI